MNIAYAIIECGKNECCSLARAFEILFSWGVGLTLSRALSNNLGLGWLQRTGNCMAEPLQRGCQRGGRHSLLCTASLSYSWEQVVRGRHPKTGNLNNISFEGLYIPSILFSWGSLFRLVIGNNISCYIYPL